MFLRKKKKQIAAPVTTIIITYYVIIIIRNDCTDFIVSQLTLTCGNLLTFDLGENEKLG
jgi:hypothetical protein